MSLLGIAFIARGDRGRRAPAPGPRPPEAMLVRSRDVSRRQAASLSVMGPEEFDGSRRRRSG
jgi:hypothetical protein